MCADDNVRLRTDLRQALGDLTLVGGESGDFVSLAEQAVYEANADELAERQWDEAALDWQQQRV